MVKPWRKKSMISQQFLSKSSSSSDTSSKRMLSGPEKGSSLFLFLVALAVLLGSTKLGLGTVGDPGPGFLPFLAAVVLAFCSGIYFFSRVVLAVQKSHEPLTRSWAGTNVRKGIY